MSTVYFDLETDGLRPDCQVIELAAVAVDKDWKELEAWDTKLVFDFDKAEPGALEVNHFDRTLWNTAVSQRVAVKDFSQLLRRHASLEMISKKTGTPYYVARLAGHNAKAFDFPIIQRIFQQEGEFLGASLHVRDTLQLALWMSDVQGWTPKRGFSLESLCEHFGIDPGGHRALNDVRSTVQVAKALLTPVEAIAG